VIVGISLQLLLADRETDSRWRQQTGRDGRDSAGRRWSHSALVDGLIAELLRFPFCLLRSLRLARPFAFRRHVGQLPTKRFIRAIRAIPAPDSSSRESSCGIARGGVSARRRHEVLSRFTSAQRICLSDLVDRDFSRFLVISLSKEKGLFTSAQLASCLALINSRFQFGIFN